MALSVPRPPGVSQMMKDGARVSTIDRILMELGHRTVYFIDILQMFCNDGTSMGSREIVAPHLHCLPISHKTACNW